MLTFNLKTTFFTVKTSNEAYCCRIYFVNYIQNVHIINRTLHGSLEDMDFMFSWQEQYLTRSLRSLVRYCSCHSNIKSISSRNRVISYIYTPYFSIFSSYKNYRAKTPKTWWWILLALRLLSTHRMEDPTRCELALAMSGKEPLCNLPTSCSWDLLQLARFCASAGDVWDFENLVHFRYLPGFFGTYSKFFWIFTNFQRSLGVRDFLEWYGFSCQFWPWY